MLVSLQKLHVVCWEEAHFAPALPPPPAFVYHLDVCDFVLRVKRYLIISICENRSEKTITMQR